MFGGVKAVAKRREAMRLADQAAEHALDALEAGDLDRARSELAAVPRRLKFADGGWKPALTMAVVELASGKRRAGNAKLIEVCAGLDETSLSKDDKGYIRLYALYRAIEASKDGRAPAELRDLVDDFRFDQILVDKALKTRFPLKKVEDLTPAPPPMAPPPTSEID